MKKTEMFELKSKLGFLLRPVDSLLFLVEK